MHETDVGRVQARETQILKVGVWPTVGACFEVYKVMGCGFLEAVYQECLEMELTLQGSAFQCQPELKLRYKGTRLKQTYEPDFILFDKIVLEIKAVTDLNDEFRAQVFRATNVSKFVCLRKFFGMKMDVSVAMTPLCPPCLVFPKKAG